MFLSFILHALATICSASTNSKLKELFCVLKYKIEFANGILKYVKIYMLKIDFTVANSVAILYFSMHKSFKYCQIVFCYKLMHYT